MENQNQSEKKLKIDDKEYLIESLPDEAKQLIAGLRTSDLQTNMFQDTLRLIAISKTKMVEDLKIILKDIEPISGNNQ
tara:strand:+ start:105 stop:338 length:234 start_codon:yes stop_codon:yes gene_type:complete